jgi:hypothetical protein
MTNWPSKVNSPLRPLRQAMQDWPDVIGQTFDVVFHDGSTICARYLGETVNGVMLYRPLQGGGLLFSAPIEGRSSRKLILLHGGRGARR